MGRILYLVRHAKSSWDDPSLADIDRPLNKRGRRDAPEMGSRLRKRNILPELLISSPAVRAHKTAKEIAEKIGYSKKDIILDDGVYHAGQHSLLEIIHQLDNDTESVMLFGHNPGFTTFANALGNLDIDNIPTSGIVALEFSKSWKDIYYGDGKLLFFDYPKKAFK